MALSLSFDAQLCRVRINADNLTAPTVAVERRTDESMRWVTVRGGVDVAPSAGVVVLDDYEFSPDIPNHYRVVDGDVTYVDTITPQIDGVWLKSPTLPFLNRRINVQSFSEITRPARGGIFEIDGRSYPVAVSSVRGSRRWSMQVYTRTAVDAMHLSILLASGDILFIQTPRSGLESMVPGGYVMVGDTSEEIYSAGTEPVTVFDLVCTEVAPPGPDVAGAPLVWQTVLNAYSTWQAVIDAHETWADLLTLIGSPTDVIVP